ncbi:hypothetical protein SAMN04487910_3883 [Aquimarina amphilecti]|uniref:Glycine dehydrogenase n=1 Tax=Aquimarina amphilecti TaxID=1038014 RepID=A0A1H7UU73_AQUAM|nr:hypothetical protein [Aquimarina amphilecti]SEM00550.1 hypothetical protein SAMN04487910_3883 [Aquimarina amphilecti]
MKTNNSLLVSCEQAKFICDKNQYGEASILEIIKLNIRLIYCKVTRAYSKRNTKLTKAMKKSNVQIMDSSIKEEMKEQLRKKLAK